MPEYIIEIDTDEPLSDTDLDELRQIVIDFITPGDNVTVSISEL